MPLAPTFAPLKPWTQRLAVVNAFQQNSANHQGGLVHTTCCRGTSVTGTPTLLDVLGSRRAAGDAATGAITIGTAFAEGFSTKYLGEPTNGTFGDQPGLLGHLDDLQPHELAAAATALRREARSLASTSSSEAMTATNLLETAALMDGWGTSPKFVAADWHLKADNEAHGVRDIQRALWLFENKLARCVSVGLTSQGFDTHIWNELIQPVLADYLAGLLATLFTELDKRIVDGRPMSEQTVVFVGSEIGRFPRLNGAHGKDHFPQVPYLFFGPWFENGVFGETDRGMVAKPIALATGKPEASGHPLVLDDIGTTLLHLDGANPEVYGYAGEQLAFLVKS